MNAERHRRAAELFARAVEEQAAFLDRECGNDPELRAGVEELLAHDRPDGFLEAPAPPDSPRKTGQPAAGSRRRGQFEQGEEFGQYRILKPLGRGGMGAVFLAEETAVGRKVALKLILPERLLLDPEAEERFWREARAASRLEHPGICAVHAVDEWDGVPYMAMRYVQGETLATRLERAAAQGRGRAVLGPGPEVPPEGSRRSGGSSTRRRSEILAVVQLGEKLAHAVHYAHARGIVHRDLKPRNIMLDEQGEPLILDFGLARDATSGDPSLSGPSDQLGTPHYMAPEQVAPQGRRADPRCDVWALGVILYECLTLKKPFAGQSLQEIYRAILEGEPEPLARLDPHIPRDLQILVAKALEKDRERRFATALELAEELHRVRAYLPIRTKPPGPVVRARRWTQRNPVAATFLAMLSVGLGISVWLLFENRATQNRLEARVLAMAAPVIAERDPKLAFKCVRDALERDSEPRYYFEVLQSLMGQLHEVKSGPMGKGWRLFGFSPDSRRFVEWSEKGLELSTSDGRRLTTLGAGRGPSRYAFSLDSAEIAVGTEDGPVLVYSADGRLLDEVPAQAGGILLYVSDGRLLEGAPGGTVRLWDRGRRASRELRPPAGKCIRFCHRSPDGRFLVTTEEDVGEGSPIYALSNLMTWDLERDAPPTAIEGLAGVTDVTCSKDRFAVASLAGRLSIWRYDGTLVHEERCADGGRFWPVAFDPAGRRLAAATIDGDLRLYDRDGALERTWRADPSTLGIDFSPDGRLLVTASYFQQRAQVWDVFGNEVARLAGHHDGVDYAAFCPDGRTIVTGSTDQTSRLWRTTSVGARILDGRAYGVNRGFMGIYHIPQARSYVATPLGRDPILIWDEDFTQPRLVTGSALLDTTVNMRSSPDGKQAGLSSLDGRILLLDLAQAELRTVGKVTTPDQNTFAIPLTDGRVVSHEARRPVLVEANAPGRIRPLALRDEGGSALVELPGMIRWLDVAPDECRLISSCGIGIVQVWRFAADALQLEHRLEHPNLAVHSQFLRDCRHVLTACDDGLARLWDLDGPCREPARVYGTHLGHIRGVAVSPDESLFLTIGSDEAARVWDRTSGALRMTLRGQQGMWWRSCFSADGRHVLTASRDGMVRWWWIHDEDLLRETRRLGRELGLGPISPEERRNFGHLLSR